MEGTAQLQISIIYEREYFSSQLGLHIQFQNYVLCSHAALTLLCRMSASTVTAVVEHH